MLRNTSDNLSMNNVPIGTGIGAKHLLVGVYLYEEIAWCPLLR